MPPPSKRRGTDPIALEGYALDVSSNSRGRFRSESQRLPPLDRSG